MLMNSVKVIILLTAVLSSVSIAVITTPSGDTIPVYLSSPCFNAYSTVEWSNVTLVIYSDKNQAIKLMQGDSTMRVQNKSEGQLYAVCVSAAGQYGGYPEDLAEQSILLGYDMVILRSMGDNYHAGSTAYLFWRKFKCPQPVLRFSNDHFSKLADGQILSMSPDPYPDYDFAFRISVFHFIVQGLIIPFLLVSIGIFKLAVLHFSGLLKSTGTLVCILCMIQGVLQCAVGVKPLACILNPGCMSAPAENTIIGMGAIDAVLSLYVVAIRFHVVYSSATDPDPQSVRPKLITGFVFTLLAILLYIAGLVAIVNQTPSSTIGWFNLAAGYYVLFRFAMAIYFLWGYVKVMQLLAKSEASLDKNAAVKLRFMSVRLLVTAVFITAGNICSMIAVFPSAFYYNHGSYSLALATLFTGFSAVSELLAVQTKHAGKMTFGYWWQKLQSNIKSTGGNNSAVTPNAANV